MILDNIRHLDAYRGLYPALESLKPFLERLEQEHVAPGTYEIAGKRVYAVVQQYRTRPASTIPWEFHRKYIDVQYLHKGEEDIGWCSADTLQGCSEYNEEKDCVVSSVLCSAPVIRLTAGEFAIFGPQDAHKPGCMHIAAGEVQKVVFKIALEE